ncbi:acyltransferase [candidate division KSB1 bacterium]
MKTAYKAHEWAIVESDSIGAGTRIWAFTHIMKGAQIGSDCNIGEGCYIESNVIIGNNVTIKNNICVWDRVTIEDDCFLGPNVVLTNVLKPRARFKKGLEAFHPTLIKRGTSIGANATIICGITIGEYAFIGAGAVINRDVPSYALIVGNPGKIIGYACECGERIDFSIPCECGRKYVLNEQKGCVRLE